MTSNDGQDYSDISMLQLFSMEVEAQTVLLNDGLLALERAPRDADSLEALMRAAHSLKGAARIVQLEAAERLAHAMEDCFVAAQEGRIVLTSESIEVLLQSADMLTRIAQAAEADPAGGEAALAAELDGAIAAISAILSSDAAPSQEAAPTARESPRSPTVPAASPALAVPTSEPSSTPPLFQDASMLQLFGMEVEAQTALLNDGLLALERAPRDADSLEALMRAAHSLKGAARIVQLEAAERLAHAMEDCFVAAQEGRIVLTSEPIEVLLQSTDTLTRIAQAAEADPTGGEAALAAELDGAVAAISAILISGVAPSQEELPQREAPRPSQTPAASLVQNPPEPAQNMPVPAQNTAVTIHDGAVPAQHMPVPAPDKPTLSIARDSGDQGRVVRVTAENLNRLMGLAGESLVESRWLEPFAGSLRQLKRNQLELSDALERLRESLAEADLPERVTEYVSMARRKVDECRHTLSDRLTELDHFARRSENLSDRLYREAIASRMRPFDDGVRGFPRMVRDIARKLGKKVKLDIVGRSTEVDRDILERLEAPLSHLLRNAIDHGIELPEERLAVGKPEEAALCLEAAHRGGMLSITVSDDGRGIELEPLRQKIVSRQLASAEMVATMNEAELMEFLFLPAFSTADQVTEISGRGVGLDVVHSMAQEVGGAVRAASEPGKGMHFYLQLPLTLSVLRTLLVDIAGEPYAFPLARIDRALTLSKDDIDVVADRQYFTLDGQHVGLVTAQQVLEVQTSPSPGDAVSVIVISDRLIRYGLVVDRFLGGSDLVVQPLDPRLGKVPDISAAALTEDGSPILIIDVEDVVRSVDNLLAGRRLHKVGRAASEAVPTRKRILVIDDSITVREVERQLLENSGYEVEVAVDGMDGWNAVRMGRYDLVITDVDMPRMNGIELVSQIKNDPQLRSMPVMIVSYKGGQEDRARGLEAGANYYLPKRSFHDETLLHAVVDLIGGA